MAPLGLPRLPGAGRRPWLLLLLAGIPIGPAPARGQLSQDVPVTIIVEPGEAISPHRARAPEFLLDRNDLLIVVDQLRGFFLGRFLAPPGMAPESPAYPGGVGLESPSLAGPPLPPNPLTSMDLQYGFPVMARGSLAGSPCVADLDHDGRCEIALATTEGSIDLLSFDGEERAGWPLHVVDGFYAAPSAGDLDGDGRDEIVIPGISGRVYAWSVEGRPVPGWPVRLVLPGQALEDEGRRLTDSRHSFAEFFGPAALGDIDADGTAEVSIAAAQGAVWLLGGEGKIRPGWPQQLPPIDNPPNPGSVYASPALGDLDDDGMPDIVLATNACRIHAWKASGEVLPGWPVETPHRARAGYSDVALGDINEDGRLEVLLTTEHGARGSATVAAYSGDGKLLEHWPYALPDAANAGTALGDVTGDGTPEVVAATIGGDAAVVVLDGRSGRPLPGWPLKLRRQTVNASPLIADLDGDGLNDILVAALATGLVSDAWVWAFNARGVQLDGFPIMLPQDEIVRAAPVTTDLDGDGDIELLVATEHLNSLYAWDLKAICDPLTMPWAGLARSASRCACLRSPILGVEAGAQSIPGGRRLPIFEDLDADGTGGEVSSPWDGSSIDLWPPAARNPEPERATSASSAITFDLDHDTRVRLIIFDIKGLGVRQLLRHRLPPGSYRILWDGQNDAGEAQSSGIYFYQLILDGRARTQQLLLLK